MSYRPDGWKNPHQLNLDKPCFQKKLPEIWNMEPQYSDFEAGADAMLKGIKELLQKEANECAGTPYGSACLLFLEEKLGGNKDG